MAPNTNSDPKPVILPSESDSDSDLNTTEKSEQVVAPQLSESDDDAPHEHEEVHLQLSVRHLIEDTRNLDWSKVLWDMVFFLVVHHIFSLYAVFLLVTGQLAWQTVLFTSVTAYAGGLGITMGTHRLWTHKAFKAVLPVRIALMVMNSIAFQESIYLWCQNHRVHHKWSDTDADFTNSRRGFFFAHMGWKMYQTHPDVIKRRKQVDCTDLMADPVVKFQHNYYYDIAIPISFIIPALIPWYFWNESLVAACMCVCLRVAITFHVTWCINSVAHLYGYKPYDTTLKAYEHTILGPFALGEGWHNYHHAFPRDYRASEMDGWGVNFTTMVIQLLNKFGWTYDLQTVSEDHVATRTARTGVPALRPKKD